MFIIVAFVYNRLSDLLRLNTAVRYRDIVYYDVCLLILIVIDMFV